MAGRSAHLEAFDPEFYTAVGQRVARYRLAEGKTQEQVALACGLSRASIANLEAGRQQTPTHTLAMIARELGLRIADLMPDAPLPDLSGLVGVARRLRDALADFIDEIEPAPGGGEST